MAALVARLLRHGRDDDGSGRSAFDTLAFRMVEACLAIEAECLQHEVDILRGHGLSACIIAETLVPRVARELGDMWCEDNLAFSRVTIGCSRLQGLLRDLGSDWYGPAGSGPPVLEVVLVVPAGEHHTLGGLVMTGRLRRLGYGVRAIMGETAETVSRIVSHCDGDIVLISASWNENLDKLAELVETTREASPARTIIAIGGSLLLEDDACRNRIMERTGADLVTNDLDEALRRCRTTNVQLFRPPHGTDASRRTI